MNEIAELQRRWLAGLLTPEISAAAATRELSGGNRTPEAAFAIYVNSVRGAIISSLTASFPATVAELGPRLGLLLPGLLATQPPASSDLCAYDATFVASLVGAGDRAADLARFEWMAQRVRHLRPAPGLSAAQLYKQDGPLRLNRHVTVFATERWPPVAVEGVHFWALVGGDIPQRRPLARAEYAMLCGLGGPAIPLVDALRLALFVNEDFDPLPLLEWLVAVRGLMDSAAATDPPAADRLASL